MFGAAGVPAEAMYGAMPDEERKGALERYRTGETKVLTNYMLLTEGFNAPSTSCIILARPSKSELVIVQQIGRGTRLYPGKEDCLVIDVRDVTNGKNLFTASSLAGLPAEFKPKGKSMFRVAKKYEELDRLAPDLARLVTTPEEVEEQIAVALARIEARKVDLLRRKERLDTLDRGGGYVSPYMWYSINEKVIQISPNMGETTYNIFEGTDNLWGILSRGKDGVATHHGNDYPSRYVAMQEADRIIAAKHQNTLYIERNARWTNAPASEKQLAILAKYVKQISPEMTKGEAATRISAIFARKKFGVPRSEIAEPCFV
jgi:hypothetical protein